MTVMLDALEGRMEVVFWKSIDWRLELPDFAPLGHLAVRCLAQLARVSGFWNRQV